MVLLFLLFSFSQTPEKTSKMLVSWLWKAHKFVIRSPVERSTVDRTGDEVMSRRSRKCKTEWISSFWKKVEKMREGRPIYEQQPTSYNLMPRYYIIVFHRRKISDNVVSKDQHNLPQAPQPPSKASNNQALSNQHTHLYYELQNVDGD